MNDSYWQERAERRILNAEKSATQMLKDLQKQYDFKYELKTKGRTKLGYTIKL